MSAERTASLDQFRVIAITCVMLAHGSLLGMDAFPSLRYVTIIFGVIGVELFFVLSGFLIGRQLLNVGERKQSVTNFWARRWFRTLPNYYLFLGLNFALYVYVFNKPAGGFSLKAGHWRWRNGFIYLHRCWCFCVLACFPGSENPPC
jgi:peptidoglycan/LPS O-acetylase OafA/YrhL